MFLAVCLIVTTIPTYVFADVVTPSQIGNYFNADNETGELEPTPLNGSSENSYENGKVKVSKTISSTGVENEFEVTLTVKTTEEVNEEVSSADAATVIVIDASSSMTNKDGTSKTRMENARAAAQAFINGFVADNATRKVAIVKFSGLTGSDGSLTAATTVSKDDNGNYGWVDASDLATANNNIIDSTLTRIVPNGGTCTEAGLILAKNLLSETLYNEDGEEITNKNIILLTDGQPTYGVGGWEENSKSTENICLNGNNIEGNGRAVKHTSGSDTHKGAEREAAAIKDMEGVTAYAIYVGSQVVDCDSSSCYLTSETTGADWLSKYCNFITLEASGAGDIVSKFQQILTLIELKAQAWETTDPMGSHVDFQGVTQTSGSVASSQVKYEDGALNWDIKNGAEPTTRDLGNSVTEYTYTLKYKITLDNLDGSYEAGEYYAANGKTGVTYVLTETKSDGQIDIKNGTAYFDVPSVMGFAGDLAFTKVDSLSGEPVAGAEFTLTTTDKAGWSMTATSDASGYVSFEGIPSGHTYTMTETIVPAGYDAVGPATVTVSYGNVAVEGLEISEDGKVSEPNKVKDISGTKVWNDNKDQDGVRPESININLLADGEVVATKTVTAEDDWSWTFENVPTHNGGREIVYTITEKTVAEYTTDIDNDTYTVTNTYETKTVDIAGSKTWDDNKNQDGKRPSEITINLLADGKIVDTKTVTEKDGWAWSFTDLDKYRDGGVEIKYEISEEPVPEYTAKVEGFNVTNTHKIDKISVSGSKTWDDNEDQDGMRPDKITINLFANGEKVDSKTVTEKDNWSWTFSDLNKYEAGKEIVYTITEEAVDNYTTEIKGYDVTNSHTIEKVNISGAKTWNDEDDQDGVRPGFITINLLANGKVLETKTVTADDNWKWEFSNKDKYADGKEIRYTITEEAVPGYVTKVDGYNVTNTHETEKVDIKGAKTWNDANDQDGVRPTDIIVTLLANGEKVAEKTVTAADGWKWTFEGMDKYEDHGKQIVYTIDEVAVENYTTEIDGYNVTNTYVPKTVAVSGAKTWVDNNDQDGVRPDDITINLLADGKEVAEKTVTADDGWKWSFTDLAKYRDGGVEIVYTITEDAVENYDADVNGYNVTNTHEPATVGVSGAKTWVDNNDQDGVRPEAITINLLADGKIVDTKKVTADDGWKWSFTELAKYRDGGVEIKYTISEEAVAGYTTAIDGYNVTNTHTVDKVDVSGTKTWEDKENQDGIRPESITINLLADGKVVETKNVTAENNWKWTFSGLDKYRDGGVEVVYTITEETVDGYVTKVNGFNVTNSHETATVDIAGAKTWADNNDQDGVRPEYITINLIADGEEVAEKTVTAKDNWKWSFEGMDKYRDGGKTIVYTITEDAVAGYTTETDGYNVTNTHETATVGVSGAKTWVDNNDQDGVRPDEITINLLADGKEVAEKKVTADDGWKWSFTDLDKYRDGGVEIVYTITEKPVIGYETAIDGYDVTNTHKPATVEVSGAKTWVDANDQDGIRPEAITINLLADGEVVDTKTVTAADEWTWEFTDLAKYRDGGIKIVYTVSEDAVEGYETTYKDYNVTNTHKVARVEVSGTKTWADNNDQDGVRPESIKINLLADGEVVDTETVTAADEWTWTFDNLNKYRDGGVEIVYTVSEKAVEGYETVVDGFNVTNTHETATVEVSGTKTWADNNDQDGVRPESITINLLADGEVVDTKVVTAEDEWTWTFSELDKFKDGGKEIVYTITENAVEGYETVVDGFNVTNTHETATVEVSGAKTWADNNDQDGVRPETITINLLADGEVVDTKVVTAEDEWTWTFSELDKYRDGGVEIVYTVNEEAVDGYTTAIDGYNITNTHTVAKVDISGTKTWADKNNQDGVRPESITINLLADGEVVETKTVTAEDEWTWTFEGMDKYRDGGVEIVYTVTEDLVDGYEAVVDGFNVTNSHETATVDIAGTKTWADNNDQDGVRPEAITINLLADGEVVATKTVTAEEEWTWTFEGMDKYRDGGVEIVYTVSEDAVEGYEATIDGYDVTNTHAVAKVDIAGSKTWADKNNQDGVRPESITINLLADGEVVDTKVVTAENEWTWTFEGMDKYRDGGVEIVYTITEEAVEGYETVVDGFNVTNSHETETVDIAGVKTWVDGDNIKGLRPETITINLLADGEVVDTKVVTAEDEWTWTFEGMDKYRDGGVEIVYTVSEEAVEGYLTIVDGYNVTNTATFDFTIDPEPSDPVEGTDPEPKPEPKPEPQPQPEPQPVVKPEPKPEPRPEPETPDTGDHSNMSLWTAIMAFAAAGFAGLNFKRKEEDGE